jgi:primosomal protein N' (replication factor Y)
VSDRPPSLLAHVVTDLSVPRVFTYRVPPELAATLAPGQRVRVPFRGRPRIAVVVGLEPGRADGFEAVAAAVDPVPALSPALLALARWAAAETACAWGEAVFRALPPGAPAVAASVEKAPRASPPAAGGAILATGRARGARVEDAVAGVLAGGGQALLLAPEIDQARAWAGRLEARTGHPVTLVTSAASPRARWTAWWALAGGHGPVAAGTRAAAWLPIAPLHLAVVLDEEDPAHKAPDAPRWHARELALERMRREGGTALLASAAPSLESWVRVRTGRMSEIADPPGGWPAVERATLPAGAGEPCLSPGLREAGRAALAGGGSVLLLVNRLGFGRVLACLDCGAARRCAGCRVALVFHREARALGCRLCGQRVPAASLCGRCRGRRLEPLGWGTERVETEARRAWPEARVVRYDSTVTPAAAAAARAAFRSGAARVLVGTHMALRLLEETPVAAAALVDADATLNRPDFRAAERTLQLAWRLAEGVAPGGALWLQSCLPEHPVLQALAAGDRERFYVAEWAERQELGYPPARRMARLLAEGRDAPRLAEELAAAARPAGPTVLGPAALAGGRTQVVLLGGAELPGIVAELLAPFRGRRRLGGTRLAVDVDPVELP